MLTTIQELALSAYNSYFAAAGGVNLQGIEHPKFENVPTQVRAGWKAAVLSLCRIGDRVQIHTYGGICGYATIIEKGKVFGTKFAVRMDDGTNFKFWAEDHTIVAVEIEDE